MVANFPTSELQYVKEYIVDQMKALPGLPPGRPSFLDELDEYLQRFIDEVDGDGPKDPDQLKAGRQLLCNIGIDLKHLNVPPEHYLAIFCAIDMADHVLEARRLFNAAIVTNKLFYRQSQEDCVEGFRIMIFPSKDLEYYNDTSGLTGKTEENWEESGPERLEDFHAPLKLKTPVLYKGGDMRYFWVTTRQHLDEMISRAATPLEVTSQVVDQLGLSHFDIEKEGQKKYFYIDLGEVVCKTFKPNATVVDWDNPRTGFLSCFKRLPMGHTFSITGYRNFHGGAGERVFWKQVLKEEEKDRVRIEWLDPEAMPPMDIERSEIIDQAIKRFKQIV